MCERRTFLLTLVAITMALSTPALANDVTYDELFFIQRSKNANEVHYDARVTRGGALDPKDPMVAYWINKAEDGSRSPITVPQKAAYGYDCELTKDGTSWQLKLSAFKKRPMWIVKAENGKWRVRTTIASKDAYLTRLFVETDESGPIPKVLFVEVFGDEMPSGAPVHEHIDQR